MKVYAYLEDGLLRGQSVKVNPDHDEIIVSWLCWPLARYRRTDRITADGSPIYVFAGKPPW